MKKLIFILPLLFVMSCGKDETPVFTKATVETKTTGELVQDEPTNKPQEQNNPQQQDNPQQQQDNQQQQEDNSQQQNNNPPSKPDYKNINVADAVEYFSTLTDGEHFVSLTGELSQEIVNQIGDILRQNPTPKINLDLSETTGLKSFLSNYYEKDKNSFKNCNGLISVIMPKDLKRIEERAFENCLRLKTVTLNDGLEYIGSYAFAVIGTGGYSSALEKINIPSTVTAIGAGAFYGGSSFYNRNVEFSIANPDDWYYTENKTYWEFKDDGTPLDKLTSEILNDGGIWQETEDGKRSLKQAYFYKL